MPVPKTVCPTVIPVVLGLTTEIIVDPVVVFPVIVFTGALVLLTIQKRSAV